MQPFIRQGYYPSDDDYYIILDVDFRADQDTIASAYKKLARRFHPDKNNQDERSRKEAEVIFHKIKTAYDVLSDPRQRQIYDTLGPEGLKLDGWKLVTKQMTAQEIRDEYLRIQKEALDRKHATIAKPYASFTMAIDASSVFARVDKTDIYDDEDSITDVKDLLPSLNITSLSTYMSVENNLDLNHKVTLSGDLSASNGTGSGSFGTKYRYKYSPDTEFDISYRFGETHLASADMNHRLNDKTSINVRGFVLVSSFVLAPGCKITLSHNIRNNIIGKVSYKESINTSVTTSLTYINAKLMFDVITSYKLSASQQRVSVDFGYKFNRDASKLSVTIGADTDEGVTVAYGCETRVSKLNIIGAALSFSLTSGVTLKLSFNRANQEFNIPIYLSDEVHSAPVFYGTMTPLIAYYLLDRCYLKHYKKLG